MGTIFRDRVEVAGITFNTKVPDELGVRYYCDLMDGWEDTAIPTPVTASFTYNDGVVAGDRFPLKEQYIEFGGYILAPTNLALERAKDKLKLSLAQDAMIRLARFSPVPKAMDVRPSGALEFPQTIRSKTDNASRFLMQVMAPWPFKEGINPEILEAGSFSGAIYFRKYTPYHRVYASNMRRMYESNKVPGEVTRPDNLTIINDGTANALPTVEIYGPLKSGEWSLVNESTNQILTFDFDLGVEPLVINNKEKVATISGQSVDYFMRGDWLTLVPGTNRIRLLTSDDAPGVYFRITTYDTYR